MGAERQRTLWNNLVTAIVRGNALGMLVNPKSAGQPAWSRRWTQEVAYAGKNAHGEELQGILAMPTGRHRLPLVVDPYSSWRNRFLNIPVLGNYEFVRAGLAYSFRIIGRRTLFRKWLFGTAYVGASNDQRPSGRSYG